MATSSAAFDLTLGAPLAASWIMAFLLSQEATQGHRYYKTYPQDALWRKASVGIMLGFDVVTVISCCVFTYLYNITHWGDLDYLLEQHWPVSVYLIAIGCTQSAVQIFLIARIHHIARKAWLTSLLSIGPICVLAGAIATAVINLSFPLFTDRWRARTPVTVWLVLLLATNLSISGTLIWRLCKQRAETDQAEIKAHWAKIKHIWYSTWFTGVSTSVICAITLVVYLTDVTSNVPVAMAGPMSGLYTLMVLTNLNNRPSPTAILDGGGIAPLEMHGHVEFSTIEEAKMDIHEDQLSTKDHDW